MKISDRVKLPLRICQGTVKQRHQLAEKYLSNFVSFIDPVMAKNSTLSLNCIRHFLLKSLPYKDLAIEILKSPDEQSHFMVHANENNYVDILTLALRTDKNGEVGEDEKNDLYHEAWHLFENLTTPKLFARFSTVEDYKLEQYETFYHQNFYTIKKYKPKFLNKKLDKFLKNYNNEDKVNFLQFLRQDLKAELSAYTLAEKHAPDLCPIYESFRFPKKIEVAENYLKALFTEIRSKSNR